MTSTYICDSFVGDLPDDLLSKIIEICGRESYAFLASFVRAGPRSKKLVYSTNVLRACNLSPLFFDRARWMLWENGRARRFFEACLRERNPQAIYYDSLDRLVNGGDFHGCVNG
ncbi:unnamed protein product [Microthlaspi erraticum]|uniref:F-box domain-containing protein n=1 Tax=Microthlaspi erraticum TaxID=1685480 RepID=A0A6D2I6Q0_9BRAS|nr:unnamed protein product [Microthlaspi erraticum]